VHLLARGSDESIQRAADNERLQVAVDSGRNGSCNSIPKRGVLLLLGFSMEAVCYADRTNISLAIMPISEQYGYSDSVKGIVLASFFVGYAATQILGGWAAKKYGSKPVLGWAVAGYSLCTLLTPAAAATNVQVLCACRVALGLAEGASLPCVHQLTAEWVPPSERSRFLTACTSGQFLGTIAAMSCAPFMKTAWPMTFYLFGLIGFLWVAAWQFLAASTPAEHPTISPEEREFITAAQGCDDSHTSRTVPWSSFAHSAFGAIVTAHWSHNWGWYLLLSWLPKFLVSEYGVSLEESGLMLLPVYAIPFITSNASGHLADRLLQAGCPLRRQWQLY